MQRLYMPLPGFLRAFAPSPKNSASCLIFDEVVTGFRMGLRRRQEYFGVVPDLCTLGKIVGGGFPLAAIAGKAEIMAHFDKKKVGPKGYLPFVGTLNANPIASHRWPYIAEILQRPEPMKSSTDGEHHSRGRLTAHEGCGRTCRHSVSPGMFDIYFTSLEQVRNFRESQERECRDHAKFSSLLAGARYLAGRKFYISLAHNEEDVEQTVNAIRNSPSARRAVRGRLTTT